MIRLRTEDDQELEIPQTIVELIPNLFNATRELSGKATDTKAAHPVLGSKAQLTLIHDWLSHPEHTAACQWDDKGQPTDLKGWERELFDAFLGRAAHSDEGKVKALDNLINKCEQLQIPMVLDRAKLFKQLHFHH